MGWMIPWRTQNQKKIKSDVREKNVAPKTKNTRQGQR